VIVAAGLHKSYGAVRAVGGVSFRAEDGKITGVLGPNGAGKTTTLRMLSTLVTPDSGTASIDGIDVRSEPRMALRRLGMLPDSRGLYPRLTAREHIEYFGRLHGLAATALNGRVDELARQLQMDDIIDRRVAGFSQGERTKVAIARALVHGPRNVVLDEATNGLDVMSARALRRLVRGFADAGMCVLFSSHVMQEVAELCDHIVVFARGVVVAEGSPAELRARTAEEDLESAFVRIIGSGAGLE
jgi:sodium transport system ATP-binding protein